MEETRLQPLLTLPSPWSGRVFFFVADIEKERDRIRLSIHQKPSSLRTSVNVHEFQFEVFVQFYFFPTFPATLISVH